MRLPGHAATYEVERDPEGNFWTVSCECGRFEESTSSRREARFEHSLHKVRQTKTIDAFSGARRAVDDLGETP